MQLFYAHKIVDNQAFFDQEETQHCSKTLRKKVGEQLKFTDGKGKIYAGSLQQLERKQAILKIEEVIQEDPMPNFQLHLAIAPTKNISRLEWFLEKATEIGVQQISLLLCQRSERKKVRLERLEKIILAAAKQSLKSRFPVLNNLERLSDFLDTPAKEAQTYIAHCNQAFLPPLKQFFQQPQDSLILIGPEGDFSLEEVAKAKAKGFQEVSLGKARLRTETAGMVACHTAQLLMGQ